MNLPHRIAKGEQRLQIPPGLFFLFSLALILTELLHVNFYSQSVFILFPIGPFKLFFFNQLKVKEKWLIF